jgi:ATP-dependent Clp protease ATP-binding subunit ClpB
VDFRNTVLVMTSNLGSQQIQEMGGAENYAAMKAAVMETVKVYFRPEFINRIDEVVVFHSLERDQIRAIAELQVGYLQRRLKERHMDLELTASAIDKVAEAGFDPVYGARPLKRVIQNSVENPLAQRILAGEFLPSDVIIVDTLDGRMVFRKSERKVAVA